MAAGYVPTRLVHYTPEEAFAVLHDDKEEWLRNAARRVLNDQPSAGPTEGFDTSVARFLLRRIVGDA